jgi:hypothetical protein
MRWVDRERKRRKRKGSTIRPIKNIISDVQTPPKLFGRAV